MTNAESLTDRSSSPTGRRRRHESSEAKPHFWFSVFGIALLSLAVARVPRALELDAHAFGDFGANLTAQALLDQGLRPAVDFGCIYGLLPLWVGRIWFGVLGRNSENFIAATIVCNMVLAWILSRFVVENRVGRLGIALLAAMIPQAFTTAYGSFTHALEPLLLSWMLLAQSQGRRASALAAATTCLFVKPSMAFIAGAVLILLDLHACWRESPRNSRYWWRIPATAASVAIGLAVALSVIFGPESLIRSLSPVSGARIYRLHHFGFFFGHGRNFWAPPGVRLTYYLGTFTATWMVATAVLIGSGLLALRRILLDLSSERRSQDETIVNVMLMHLAFIFLFFGTAGHWATYSFLLPFGLVLRPGLGSKRDPWTWLLIALALLADTSAARDIPKLWNSRIRSDIVAGLWAPPDEITEWSRVLVLCRGAEAVMLHRGGDTEVLFPSFGKPQALYLDRGAERPADVERKLCQVSTASVVVLSKVGGMTTPDYDFLAEWPEFRAPLAKFELVLDGKFFKVYRRR
ncbi:hypothetical protein ACYOEI_09690 [Singulisphaera rosea]